MTKILESQLEEFYCKVHFGLTNLNLLQSVYNSNFQKLPTCPSQ